MRGLRPEKVIDPEWVERNKEKIYKEMERMENFGLHNYWDTKEFFPEKYFKELEESDLHWIMVKTPPVTPILVPAFSIWLGQLVNGNSQYKGVHRKLFAIYTPLGELRLTMNEIVIIDINTYLPMVGKDLQIKFINDNPLNKKIHEQIFYIRSRGISKKQAYLMLLDKIKSPQFCYFVFHTEYQKMFTRYEMFILEDVVSKE